MTTTISKKEFLKNKKYYLKKILLGLRNNFSELLENFSSLIITRIDQHTYFPEGFLE